MSKRWERRTYNRAADVDDPLRNRKEELQERDETLSPNKSIRDETTPILTNVAIPTRIAINSIEFWYFGSLFSSKQLTIDTAKNRDQREDGEERRRRKKPIPSGHPSYSIQYNTSESLWNEFKSRV